MNGVRADDGALALPASHIRGRVDQTITRALDRGLNGLVEHWLAVFNALVGAYAALPLIAPLLLAAGARAPASAIFWLYSAACHQMPSHSWFVLGQQMAYCQRNTAIYTTMFLAGLWYARRRWRAPALPLWAYALVALPMALDGGSALVGLRDSTPALRTLTGALLGVGTVWFAYPLVDRLLAAPARRPVEGAPAGV